MTSLDKEWFINKLKECGAVKYGDFTLASGQKSNFYIDIKIAITHPDLLGAMAKAMAPYSKGYTRIAGVELGAVPIAAALSLETKIPYIIMRKEKKDHGTRKMYEGEMRSGDKVLFVEDVVTTGGTLGTAITSLRSQGAVIDTVVCVVDREEGGFRNLQEIGVKLESLIKGQELQKG